MEIRTKQKPSEKVSSCKFPILFILWNEQTGNSHHPRDCNKLRVNFNEGRKPKYPEKNLQVRLRSIETWPTQESQDGLQRPVAGKDVSMITNVPAFEMQKRQWATSLKKQFKKLLH